MVEKIDKIRELLIVPSVDEKPKLAINQMKILNLLVELRAEAVQLTIPAIVERFSDDVIDKMALDKYPEDFCWYGSNPPRHIDDNARDRLLWRKGFKDALNNL